MYVHVKTVAHVRRSVALWADSNCQIPFDQESCRHCKARAPGGQGAASRQKEEELRQREEQLRQREEQLRHTNAAVKVASSSSLWTHTHTVSLSLSLSLSPPPPPLDIYNIFVNITNRRKTRYIYISGFRV